MVYKKREIECDGLKGPHEAIGREIEVILDIFPKYFGYVFFDLKNIQLELSIRNINYDYIKNVPNEYRNINLSMWESLVQKDADDLKQELADLGFDWRKF